MKSGNRTSQEGGSPSDDRSPDACCMVFNEYGNAFDAFDYTPEALEQKARELRAQLVTMEPCPFAELSRGNWP